MPVPHFGVALSVDDFHGFADRLKKAGIKFIIEPRLRFEGQPGEQVKVTPLCVLVVVVRQQGGSAVIHTAGHVVAAIGGMGDCV